MSLRTSHRSVHIVTGLRLPLLATISGIPSQRFPMPYEKLGFYRPAHQLPGITGVDAEPLVALFFNRG